MTHILDEAWFDRYQSVMAKIGETYEMLEPRPETLARKWQEFEASDYAKNISLLSDRATPDVFAEALQELDRLRADIAATEQNDLVRRAYGDAISAAAANARLIIAGITGDKQAYAAANAELYGQPDQAVFAAACNWIRTEAEQSLRDENQKIARYAARVCALVPNRGSDHELLIPTEDLFRKVRELHRQPGGYYDQLFGPAGLPARPYIDQDEGDVICKQVLSNIGSDFSVTASQNNIWAVMASRKQLVRPAGYRLDRDEFIGIVCHEIGSHILEEVNGAKQPLKLLSKGLAGYERGNEGRAFLREQIVYGSERTFLRQFAWEYIVLLHFSVSLAAGLHEKPYTFAELYNTLFALYSFWRERRMPFSTNNEAFARQEAWFLTVRVLKGTDGTGGAYMKDTVYLEGNVRCWQHAADDPSIILFGDQGKFDMTNKDHVEMVRSIQQTGA